MLPFLAAALILSAQDSPRPSPPNEPLPDLVVTRDDTAIDRSCRVVIAPGTVIADSNNDGVLHITGTNVTIEFAEGSVLRGSPMAAAPDSYNGTGIRITGVDGVTLRGARVSGFKVGIRATKADELTIELADIADNFRRHLRSTPDAEDQSDWLWPHANDKDEWATNYGCAIKVEDSYSVAVRNCRVRDTQNGLILDRVSRSSVYDNDFSYLSGWGVAMWRSTRNTVTRNALDFCIRGYSHGNYNRGQDSAGLLMFEQCSDNLIAENSITHGGDGIFGFAGKEALGEGGDDPKIPAAPPGFNHGRTGCNDNTIIGNDLSYAAAHGLEMTFSFGNLVVNNRLVGNAICGVWGGYSQESTIAHNTIEDNGLPGTREGGGINIEHGFANQISFNTFARNTVAIALWSDEDAGIRALPWAKANYKGSRSNEISDNRFDADGLALRLSKTGGTTWLRNTVANIEKPVEQDAESTLDERGGQPMSIPPADARGVQGERRPVGARAALAGREHMVMGEWGPWDHERPMVRVGSRGGSFVSYEVYGAKGPVTTDMYGEGVSIEAPPPDAGAGAPWRVTFTHPSMGVMSVNAKVTAPGMADPFRVSTTLISTLWSATFFATDKDPREDLAAYRSAAAGPGASRTELNVLDLAYGHGGPTNALKLDNAGALKADHFGMIATTTIPLTKGRWRITTLSDDGVRVLADGKPVIENWTWHAPTTDNGILTLDADREVAFTVEHFELDGYSVLKFDIERAD